MVSIRELKKDTGKQKGWRAFLEQGTNQKSSPWPKLWQQKQKNKSRVNENPKYKVP